MKFIDELNVYFMVNMWSIVRLPGHRGQWKFLSGCSDECREQLCRHLAVFFIGLLLASQFVFLLDSLS